MLNFTSCIRHVLNRRLMSCSHTLIHARRYSACFQCIHHLSTPSSVFWRKHSLHSACSASVSYFWGYKPLYVSLLSTGCLMYHYHPPPPLSGDERFGPPTHPSATQCSVTHIVTSTCLNRCVCVWKKLRDIIYRWGRGDIGCKPLSFHKYIFFSLPFPVQKMCRVYRKWKNAFIWSPQECTLKESSDLLPRPLLWVHAKARVC